MSRCSLLHKQKHELIIGAHPLLEGLRSFSYCSTYLLEMPVKLLAVLSPTGLCVVITCVIPIQARLLRN